MIDLALNGYSLGNVERAAPFRPRLTVRTIQEVVADYYGIPTGAMVAPDRSRSVAHPRQVAMYLARTLVVRGGSPISFPHLGLLFGHRDHTTIIWGCREIARRIRHDEALAEEVDALRAKLAGERRPFMLERAA